ncbi:hypothetical protein [Dyadobacter sp. CY356]|uniref:hypothetical protein n=1 Tax=Dyadobacter sp. CY356 TaxID=2906442 RepID=UPI001F44D19C|nr:hypothetical protein [Dyadobacter sp. CY356]MCF0057019.1 hypothetical protein [Dyadobacter sp. CY356]
MISLNLSFVRPLNNLNRTEAQYQSGIIKIQEYLFHLNNECRRGQYDVAQNTFLDMQQHWQRQDVIFGSLQKSSSFALKYYPSDSLATLELYLNQLHDFSGQKFNPELIIKEIRRINDKVDNMPRY